MLHFLVIPFVVIIITTSMITAVLWLAKRNSTASEKLFAVATCMILCIFFTFRVLK